jgi:hypothetical protein
MGLSSDPQRAAAQKANLAKGREKRAANLAAKQAAPPAAPASRPVVRAPAKSNPKPKAPRAPKQPDDRRDDDDRPRGGFFRGLIDW